MPDLIAIFSQARFDSVAKGMHLGDVLPIGQYTNLQSINTPLRRGTNAGRLLLVTVRPDGALWLVAVLEAPTLQAYSWTSRPNRAPIEDLSLLRTPLGLDGENAQGAEKAPRLLSSEQLTMLLGPDAVPSVDVDDGVNDEVRVARQEVSSRAARGRVDVPPLLAALFDLGLGASGFDALYAIGIDLTNTAFDAVGEAEEVDEAEEPDAQNRALIMRFIGFATDGCGDVFGLVTEPETKASCVLRYSHADGQFALVGHDVADWLARHLRDASDPAVVDDERVAQLALIRARLPPLGEPSDDLCAPTWLAALMPQ